MFMAAKLTRLIHKIAIQLHLVAESCTICSSRSRRPVRELLDTPLYIRRVVEMVNFWLKLFSILLYVYILGILNSGLLKVYSKVNLD
jgi:hypothetical protein